MVPNPNREQEGKVNVKLTHSRCVHSWGNQLHWHLVLSPCCSLSTNHSKIFHDNLFAAGLLHPVRVVRLAHSASYGGALHAKSLYTYWSAHLALQKYTYAHTCVPYVAIYSNDQLTTHVPAPACQHLHIPYCACYGGALYHHVT